MKQLEQLKFLKKYYELLQLSSDNCIDDQFIAYLNHMIKNNEISKEVGIIVLSSMRIGLLLDNNQETSDIIKFFMSNAENSNSKLLLDETEEDYCCNNDDDSGC